MQLKECSYVEIQSLISSAIAQEIQLTLKKLHSNYRELSDVLNYGEAGYIHKLLHSKKKMKITTLIKISYGLVQIKIKRNVNDITTEYIMPWNILKRAYKKTFDHPTRYVR